MADDQERHVIDLHSRTKYQPDMAALARAHVANARKQLGLSTKAFAEALKPLLPNQPLTAGLIENWETTAVPPGDVLIAAGVAARAAPLRADNDPGDDILNQLLGSRFADVAAVFVTRSEFNSQLTPQELFVGATTIDAAGLSLNLLCQQYPEDALRQLVERQPFTRGVEGVDRVMRFPPA